MVCWEVKKLVLKSMSMFLRFDINEKDEILSQLILKILLTDVLEKSNIVA